ncbi:hypothetical protein ACTWQB_04820 [Piscibacillus sp. B03]|uniref:hypothetical protein n=1 Tax=Piscibacillus sp. B03 TaxID=3457430 RepID=UPI003FCE9988
MLLKFCYLGYRYCGPGCKGPGKPINRVDVACRQHDACYERNQTRSMRVKCDDDS